VDTAGVLSGLLDASNRRDLDAAAALVAPQFEGVVPSTMSAEPDVYNGRDGLRRYFESFWEIVDDLTFVIDEIEVHGEWVLARARALGKGRSSGLPVDNHIALACTSSDGLLTNLHAYPDLEAARAALPGNA
jgi:ketosteroid isomerase-like protein